jgi:hypothetical protein
MVVAVTATLLTTAAHADIFWPIQTGRAELLANMNSGKCLSPMADDGSFSWNDGVLVQQRPCGDATPSFWTVQDMGERTIGTCSWFNPFCSPERVRTYQIWSNFSGKCLDVQGDSTATWAPVQQWTCTPGDTSMLWIVQRGQFIDTYIFKNFNSGLCLDVRGASTADFAQLQQWTCTDHNVAQNFYYFF